MIKEMMSRRPMASVSDSMSFDMPSVLCFSKKKEKKDDNSVVHGCGTLGRAANTHYDERRGLGNGSRPSALTLVTKKRHRERRFQIVDLAGLPGSHRKADGSLSDLYLRRHAFVSASTISGPSSSGELRWLWALVPPSIKAGRSRDMFQGRRRARLGHLFPKRHAIVYFHDRATGRDPEKSGSWPCVLSGELSGSDKRAVRMN